MVKYGKGFRVQAHFQGRVLDKAKYFVLQILGVSVIYCCIANNPKAEWIKRTNILSQVSVGQESSCSLVECNSLRYRYLISL